MSGPIVRKYGFPNFEKIFGNREIEHGTDDKDAESSTGTGLPPDLPHRGTPLDPTKASSSGEIAPSTEFGSAVE
jgi:hypothetical protein